MSERRSRRDQQWREAGELLRRSASEPGLLRARLEDLDLTGEQRRLLLDLLDRRSDL
jgi:hypothetical protein